MHWEYRERCLRRLKTVREYRKSAKDKRLAESIWNMDKLRLVLWLQSKATGSIPDTQMKVLCDRVMKDASESLLGTIAGCLDDCCSDIKWRQDTALVVAGLQRIIPVEISNHILSYAPPKQRESERLKWQDLLLAVLWPEHNWYYISHKMAIQVLQAHDHALQYENPKCGGGGKSATMPIPHKGGIWASSGRWSGLRSLAPRKWERLLNIARAPQIP